MTPEPAKPRPERFISVDDPDRGFYVELEPDRIAVVDALAVSGLSMEELAATGTDPAEAMAELALWIRHVVPPQTHRPVFVVAQVAGAFVR